MSDGIEIGPLSSPTDTSNLVPNTRKINTTLPLTGGGDLTADRTLDINSFGGDSGAGGTKGAVPAPGVGDAAKFLKGSGAFAAIAESDVTNLVADLAAKAPTSRAINTNGGLQGGGDLTADRTLSMVTNTDTKRYLFTNGSHALVPGVGGNIGLAGNGVNRVTLIPIVLCCRFRVSRFTFNVTAAAAAGNKAWIGIYDTSGNRLFSSGALAIDSIAVVSGGTGNVDLDPGTYYLAFAASVNTTVTFTISPLSSTSSNSIMNFNTQRFGLLAANSISASDLPSTTGALSNVGNFSPPWGIFE